ncbi:hypothetical protein [Deinococcus misasensis]|uniref:hypothetical protein n=1 Tax=Deinococcus misasensis TaxID=392413 RepID=UPI00055402F1|nr:hypothetical protein [Deinococcus misasensis]
MKRQDAGLTLLEVLLSLGLSGGLLMLAAQLSHAAREVAEMQAVRDMLTQDVSVAKQLMEHTLSHAGDSGALELDLQKISVPQEVWGGLWHLLKQPTLQLGQQGGDRVWVRWVEQIQQGHRPDELVFHIVRSGFFKSSRQSLSWSEQNLWCTLNVQSQQSICTSGPERSQPVVDHLEAFEVFFHGAVSGWTAHLPASQDVNAIGIYLRFKKTFAAGKDCKAFPSRGVDLPASATQLGIRSQNLQTQPCQSVRHEAVETIALQNQQSFEGAQP